jgi:hypothetical protein
MGGVVRWLDGVVGRWGRSVWKSRAARVKSFYLVEKRTGTVKRIGSTVHTSTSSRADILLIGAAGVPLLEVVTHTV